MSTLLKLTFVPLRNTRSCLCCNIHKTSAYGFLVRNNFACPPSIVRSKSILTIKTGCEHPIISDRLSVSNTVRCQNFRSTHGDTEATLARCRLLHLPDRFVPLLVTARHLDFKENKSDAKPVQYERQREKRLHTSYNLVGDNSLKSCKITT